MSDRVNDIAALLTSRVQAMEPALIAVRRDIHAHPELGMDAPRTAALVAAKLQRIGLSPRTGVGGHGVTAEIMGAAPGPTLLIRADMDALPITEQIGLPFASTVPGRMHACGHDIHTATLLGVGEVLAAMAPQLRGRVRLVFQPAEETVESGAAAMVADGAADGADVALAFHNWPEMPVGRFDYTRGAATASSDEFDVVLRGRSGHAARPHNALDPIVTAASIIMQLQTAVSRTMDPTRSAVLTVGRIEGGATHNIIPDACTFHGTVRCRSVGSRDLMEETFRRICTAGAAAMGVACEISYIRGAPALVNDDRVVDMTTKAVAAQFGNAALEQLVPLHRGFDGLRWAAFILHQSPWTRRCRGKREPAWLSPFGW